MKLIVYSLTMFLIFLTNDEQEIHGAQLIFYVFGLLVFLNKFLNFLDWNYKNGSTPIESYLINNLQNRLVEFNEEYDRAPSVELQEKIKELGSHIFDLKMEK